MANNSTLQYGNYEFEKYGYDKHRLKTFQTNCEKLRDLPDDDEMVGDQMVVTDKKYKAAYLDKKANPSEIPAKIAIK